MAVPKRRTSPSRKGMRRSHHRIELPAITRCPRCKQFRLRHTVCAKCGFYRGKPLISVSEES
jgi:large subunit ribosomal protein L32